MHAALFVTMTLAVFVLLCVKYAEVAIRYPGGGGVVTVATRAARLDSRFIYVPAGVDTGAVDWLVGHMAPEETIMLDDGAGLAAADRYTLERRRAGDTPVLHYRAKPD